MVHSTITQWLNSGEYLTEIDRVLTNIVRASELSNSEVEVLSAYQQVTDYLIALNNNNGEKRDAILTDGTKIAYFSFVGEEVRHTTLKVLEKSSRLFQHCKTVISV